MTHYPTKWFLVIFCIPAFIGDSAGMEERDVCAAAQRFSVDVAGRMRSGVSADREFNANGGIDAISKGMLNIINHVHSYRINGDISAARIGSLTFAKCKNGAFGKLSYADLPEQYDPAYQQEYEAEAMPENAGRSIKAPDRHVPDPDSESLNPGNIGSTTNCEMYKQRVKEIDDEMRAGYSSTAGDSLREERKKYRELANKYCS